MKGSITELGREHYRLRVFVGQGRRVSKNFRGGKREAQTELRRFIDQTLAGTLPPTPGMTVAQLIERWWEQAERTKSPNTLRAYRRYLDLYLLPAFGRVRMDGLTPQMLDHYYAKWGETLKPATIRQLHWIMASAYSQAVKWGWVDRSPLKRATPPAVYRERRLAMSPGDVRMLIDEASEPLASAIFLAAITGARRGELCALRWSDTQDGSLAIARSLHFSAAHGRWLEGPTKTHQSRTIALDGVGCAVLDHCRDLQSKWAAEVGVPQCDDPFIFSREPRGDAPWAPDGVSNAFWKLTRRLGMTWRFHDLRHFSVTQLIANGVDLRVVADRHGHAHVSTTLGIYAHSIQAKDMEAAQILGQQLGLPR